MSTPVRFTDALLYPYRERNRAALFWLPGIVLTVFQWLLILARLIAYGAVYLSTGDLDMEATEMKLLDTVFDLVGVILSLPLTILMFGYLWRLMGQWQTLGEETPPPSWKENLGGVAVEGLMLSFYYALASAVSMLPILICVAVSVIFSVSGYEILSALKGAGMLVATLVMLVVVFVSLAFWFFVTPYLLAPVVRSAKTRKLSALYNWPAAWKMATAHYGRGIRVTAWLIALALVYTFGMGVFVIATCCVGFLFVSFFSFPMQVTFFHLANQMLPEEETTSPAPDPTAL